MEPTNWVNSLVPLEVIIMEGIGDTENGTIGEKLMDSCAGIIRIATGLIQDCIAKIMS